MAIRNNKLPHLVMLCKDYDPRKFRPGAVSPKVDGVRGYYYPGEKDCLWSRQDKPIHGMRHIIKEIGDYPWPLDMELYVPGAEFNVSSGLVRSHSPTPEVIGHMIDVVRKGDLQERLSFRPPTGQNIIRLPNYRVSSHGAFMAYHKRFIEQGYEGSVIKSLHHRYEDKRGFDWMREVPIKSEDCECLGVYEGNGKMYGIAGGIWIKFNGIECKCGTMKGLTYEDRRYLLENEDEFIGMVAEIEYKNLQPSGKPRQPRFKGWRYDKGME